MGSNPGPRDPGNEDDDFGPSLDDDGSDDIRLRLRTGRRRSNLRNVARRVREAVQARVRVVRRWFFLKLFILLAGFFFSNALSTVVGQTGDWDVLVAGFLVAVVESIGFAVNRVQRLSWWARAPARVKDAVDVVNYFKCGLMFGLFVDCFKVGS